MKSPNWVPSEPGQVATLSNWVPLLVGHSGRGRSPQLLAKIRSILAQKHFVGSATFGPIPTVLNWVPLAPGRGLRPQLRGEGRVPRTN
jgi:hypothetical protein